MEIPRFFRRRTEDNDIPRLLTADDLAHFKPMDRLTPEQRVLLLDKVKYKTFGKRQILFELGSKDNKTCFLLKGKLLMTASDGKTREVEAGTANARSAIGYIQPRQYDVKALSDVEVLMLDQADLEYLLQQAPNQEEQEGWGQTEDRYTVLMSFYADLKSNSFTLPSLPDVAIKIREVTQQANCSADDVANVIQQDPAMAAKLLKVYNSPLYRGVNQDASCRDVVVRLGMAVTQQLVTVFSMRELFMTKKSQLRLAMQDLWAHSREIAAIAAVIASQIKGVNKDAALMAGLTHDLGAIPIITYAENFPELYTDHFALQETIQELKVEVGTTLMENWHFSKEMLNALINAENWDYQSNNEKVDYADLVVAAHWFSYQQDSMGIEPDYHQMPVFHKLKQHGLDDEWIESFMAQSEKEVGEINALLGA